MRALKIILLVLVLLVVVVVGGVIAAINLIDPNDFKDDIAASVREDYGRELTFDGDLEWGFWPKLRLKVGPVELGNAPGFGDEPFFAVQDFQVAVSTLPLLRSKIEMETVKLYGLRLNLAVNAEGVSNWDDFVSSESAEEDDRGGGEFAAIALGGVDIQDARITWSDATTGQQATVSDITASTGALIYGDPVAFQLSLTAAANQPALDADTMLEGTVTYDLGRETYRIEPLNLDVLMRGAKLPGGEAKITAAATVAADLRAQTASITGLDVAGLGTTLTGNLNATQIESERPGGSGRIELNGEDIARIFEVFELPAAKLLGKNADRKFSLEADFDANMKSGKVKVTTLAGRLLGAALDAELTAERANTDTPAAKGSLTAKGADLPSVLTVLAQLQGLPADTLETLNRVLAKAGDKSFDVAARFDVDMKSNRFDVPELRALLLGNTIKGDVKSSEGGKQRAVEGTLSANGPDLPSLMAIAAAFQGPESGLREVARSLSTTSNKQFSAATRFKADLDRHSVSLPELKASGLGLLVEGRLEAGNLDAGNGPIDGKLNVSGDQLAPLLVALGQTGLSKSIKRIELDAGLSGTTSDITVAPLALTAKVGGVTGSKPVDLSVKAGKARANLDKETLDLEAISVTGLGLNVTGQLNAQNISSAPTYKGKLTVPVFDLRNLMVNLGQELPAMADPQALRKFGASADLSGSPERVALDNIAITLDETNIKGDFQVRDVATTDVKFGFGIDQLNADRYLPPPTKGKSAPVTPETAAAGATQLPVEMLRALRIEGDLLIGSLQISGARLTDVKASLRAKDGMIALNPVAAELYSGSYRGDISVNATKAEPAIGIRTNLSKVNIKSMFMDMYDSDQLSGTANIEVSLQTQGVDSDRLINALAGAGKFNVEQGVFEGIDIAGVLHQAEVLYKTQGGSNIKTGGTTSFEALTGTLEITNGVIRNNDLVLDGNGFKVRGEGILVNLNDMKMKYDARVGVDGASAQRGEEQFDLGGYEVPIACRGEIGGSACKPDVGAIVGALVKGRIEKEIQKKLGDQLGGLLGLPKQEAAPAAKAAPQAPAQSAPAQPEATPEEQAVDALKKLFKF